MKDKIITIPVRLKENGYGIIIGWNIYDKIGSFIKQAVSHDLHNFRACIISNRKIYSLYGNKIKKVLLNSGVCETGFILVGDGEKYKTFGNYGRIINELIKFDTGRKLNLLVVCLGGGVVGDIGGFAASTYKRGVPFIQVPTTLLACVDSSIGGKVAVDFSAGPGRVVKNIVGQFYQPRLVFADLSFLETLPAREVLNGLAEVIKYGIIRDRKLFDYLGENIAGIKKLSPDKISYIVEKCCNIKRRVVEVDQKETRGIRTILNFGHTVGHAIEGASGLNCSHGEAVAVGMACETEISEKLGLIKKEQAAKIRDLIKEYGLPVSAAHANLGNIMKVMQHDKKFQSGKNRFVLPVAIGKVTVKCGIDENIIRRVVAGHLNG